MELPKGVPNGNVVHDLLENNAFIDLTRCKNISAQRAAACQRYGLKLERPEIIAAVVATPLSAKDPEFCLMSLRERKLTGLPYLG